MKPTLRQLQYLVALADTGSFSAAARRVAVSQPSLSSQIQDMEAVLQVTLVERGRRGAPLTPIGAELVARARLILRDMELFRTAARESGDTLEGQIRLGTLPSIGPYLLPPVLRELHERFPALRVAIREEATIDLQDGLTDGRLDAIISTSQDFTSASPLTIHLEARTGLCR
jgi:LysR family hydrogen peroxide-inducible transcriptional activator